MLTSRSTFACREEQWDNHASSKSLCSNPEHMRKVVAQRAGRQKTLPRPNRLPVSYTWAAHGPSTALHGEPATSSNSLRAAFVLVGATPAFLILAPASLPVGITCVTVIRLRCGLDATHLLL
eukprot:9494752-Pyramimonas_sp.AAC.1